MNIRMIGSCLMVLVFAAVADAGEKTVKLFNGRNLDGWYVWTVEEKHENPGIFTISDGILKIAGGKGDLAYFGGIITEKEYSDYHLVLEYKWGKPTYGRRKDRARDSGILIHGVGPDGPGPWLTSIECQIIEGGTGDILLVGNTGNNGKVVNQQATFTGEKRGGQWYFTNDGNSVTVTRGRINWWGRDPAWKDVVDFRGSQDVESPFGEWTRVECICKGDSLTNIVNGQVVNKATGLALKKGKIQVQTEGAEMYVRKIELTPLDRPE